MSVRRIVVLLPFLLIALSLRAERFEVKKDGATPPDAQICWFRAGDPASPLTRFLAASAVRCASAGSEIRLGDGTWNVFARRGDDLISDEVILVPGKSTKLNLVDAEPLRAPAIKDGEMLFAYVPAKAIAIPSNVAPKGSGAISLVLRDGKIVRVGVDRPRQGHVDVAAAVAVAKADRKDLPEITIGGARPMNALARAGETSLLFFRDVPGTSRLTVRGKRWKLLDVDLPKPVGTVVTVQIEALATSKLIAHWWTPQPFESLAQKIAECKARPGDTWELHRDDSKPFQAALLKCPGQQSNSTEYMVHRDACTVVREVSLNDVKLGGTAEFSDVPLGLYFLRYTHRGLPSVWRNVEVTDRELTEVDHEIRYYAVFGRVTRGGSPVAAQVLGTVSDANTGEYFAVLPREPRGNIEFVAPCDGSPVYKAVLDSPPPAGSRLDFDIPNGTVIIRVVDAKTHEPVPNAQSRLMILKKDKDKAPAISMRGDLTDLSGKVSIAPVPPDKELRACADHPDYDRTCSEPFSMDGATEKTVEIAAVKHFRKAGRLIAAGAIGDGELEWYTPEGRLIEMAKVQPDGSFIFTKPHAAGELVAFTSGTHPMHVFQQLFPSGDELLEFGLPAAPARTIRVTMPKESSNGGGSFSVLIGDVLYPFASVGYQLQKHHSQSSLVPGWTLQFDVLQTAPISIVFLPFEMWERAIKGGELRQDPAFFPEARAYPKYPLPDDGVVTIKSGVSSTSVE